MKTSRRSFLTRIAGAFVATALGCRLASPMQLPKARLLYRIHDAEFYEIDLADADKFVKAFVERYPAINEFWQGCQFNLKGTETGRIVTNITNLKEVPRQ